MQLGNADFSELKNFIKNVKKNTEPKKIEDLNIEIIRELAQRFFAKVVNKTPKISGYLITNWNIGSIEKHGNFYKIEVFNTTDYASYVNDGHRSRDGAHWVLGRHFIEISEQHLRQDAEKVIKEKLEKFLNTVIR